MRAFGSFSLAVFFYVFPVAQLSVILVRVIFPRRLLIVS